MTIYHVVGVQSLSQVQLFETPWAAARQPSMSFTISQTLFRLMSIESMIPSNHLILSLPLLLLPSILPSLWVFFNESVLHIRLPKNESFSFSISPSNEHPELISFRMDLLDLLAVQGTLKSLFQHHSSKASILQHSVFFMNQQFQSSVFLFVCFLFFNGKNSKVSHPLSFFFPPKVKCCEGRICSCLLLFIKHR